MLGFLIYSFGLIIGTLVVTKWMAKKDKKYYNRFYRQ